MAAVNLRYSFEAPEFPHHMELKDYFTTLYFKVMNTNTSPYYSTASKLSLYQSPRGRGHLLPKGWHNPTAGRRILGFQFCLGLFIYTVFARTKQSRTLLIQLLPG